MITSEVTKTIKQPRMRRILEAAFNGLEIVDAKKDLLLWPTADDFATAVRMDPAHCGFANTAQRVCGASQAHFFKRYVYIDHVGEDGQRRVYRYTISGKTFDTIVKFDRGQKVDTNRAFRLKAPAPSMTLKAMRKNNVAWKKSPAYKTKLRLEKAERACVSAGRELQQAKTIFGRYTKLDSPPAKDAQKRFTAALLQADKARNTFDAAKARHDEAREGTRKTGQAKPKTHDITVRSGTGQFVKPLKKEKAA